MQDKQIHSQGLEKPLISFILTYYELPVKMLCECIDSILALSIRPFEREIIVVDDGSQKSPMNDLMKYGDNIVYIRKPNGGVSTARNMALQMASGEYIQFVDSDDMLIQSAYEHCIDIVKFSKADMVMFDFCSQKGTTTTANDKGPVSGTEYMRNNNIHGTACCYLFSQSIRKSLSFTPGICYGEDEEFTAQLVVRSESLYITNAKAYFYRQHEDSVTGRQDKRHIIKRLSDSQLVITRLNNIADRMPSKERTALQRRVAQLTMDYIYNVIRLTKSRHYLERKMNELSIKGLFPLPDIDYTTKYTWFRRMTNNPTGINLLMRIIPYIHKER